ncbi:MAG: hypothetical protein A2Y57_01885 [Candidatus Woykebacteria bacterium RBG_13_40_7b]|uniref:Uncharacterized protein n=1 Tax=Candidatus Woykebacteria bacterium RBG_13_40_7b TaxID=1802594 RepID=A0A1G1WB94_9BACT|nr:MAG: hypothetical protein A2Y57_01885 [Candidatus Woykebacteria bacterium RBG_13_40_7b]
MSEALAHMGEFATSSATSDLDNHMDGWMMGGWQNMMGGWFSPFAWFWILLCLITWILIIVALVSLIRWLWKRSEG